VQLQRLLAKHSDRVTPLLVVRLPALERTAWREGRHKARAIEKHAAAAFAAAAARTLRAGDAIAHDSGSDVFLAALTAPVRDWAEASAGIDPRSALARICANMESATGLDIDSGWTTFGGDPAVDLPAAIGRGLIRGAQERERYAFFSALGHELRTPLASIRGYLETLLDGGIDEPTRTRFLSIAHRESLRLSRLVEGMFEISLLDLQATRLARTSGALDAAFDAAIDACAANASARGTSVLRAPAPAARVAIDADRLTLVLINLIDNAIKHGGIGGTVAVGVELGDADRVCVTIDDDGPGIPASDRDRIFAFGGRGQSTAPGNGIGLALVRLMLERAGGCVDVEDSPLGGARFRVCLRRN